ncbi:MAG: hybrid sensor histidine kinase/response regulator [Bacteroidales bacterium]|nr:hybrid sensor histidine kinase/response regulator [Bacteroidales bacterium]
MEVDIKNSKILIVDDIAENIQVLGNILGDQDYEIAMAMNGQEALDSVNEDKPDLILLDINMPVIDGYEVCKRLKKSDSTKEIPVIFLTANTEVEQVVKGFELGAIDFVTKPFQSKVLLQRVKIHLELQKSKQALMDSIEVKNKFFKIIAHDMRSPFNALIGFSNILIMNQNIPQDKKDSFMQIIHETSKKGLGLLENLLIWAESQSNEVKLNPEILNLHRLAENVVQLLSVTALHKDIIIENKISDDINVYADSQSVNTIFRNLISNSIKFTHKGGKIMLQATVESDEVLISVIDNGVGMSKSKMIDIFRNDKKTASMGTEGESGSGLGLFLVKDFTEKNGGKVRIESEEGIGTTFIFTLPYSPNTK